MSWYLTAEHLPDLALGADLLGTGGGGDTHQGKLMVERALAESGPIRILPPDELPDDYLVVPTGGMGAPSVVVEKMSCGDEAASALRALERYLGRRVDATMPVECGGANIMVPLLVAARSGLPVVDADGMGRAFPELHMVTFALHGIAGCPLAVADERGSVVVLDNIPDHRRLEKLARGITVQMGGISYLATYAMTGSQVRTAAIHGTVSLALALGRAVRTAREEHRDPFAVFQQALAGTLYRGGTTVFVGKIVDVERRTTGGFVHGRTRIASFDGAESCEIIFQNEYLVARIGARTAAVVPDLIIVLDEQSAEPITTERLRYGQRVRVFTISAPDALRTPAALDAFGPQAFGLDTDPAHSGSGRAHAEAGSQHNQGTSQSNGRTNRRTEHQ